MKKMIIMALVAAAWMVCIGNVVAQDAAPATVEIKKQTICPIMAGPINPEVYTDAQGKRVYFCCPACLAEFNKDPAKYIAQLEAEGVTLDLAPDVDPVPGFDPGAAAE